MVECCQKIWIIDIVSLSGEKLRFRKQTVVPYIDQQTLRICRHWALLKYFGTRKFIVRYGFLKVYGMINFVEDNKSFSGLYIEKISTANFTLSELYFKIFTTPLLLLPEYPSGDPLVNCLLQNTKCTLLCNPPPRPAAFGDFLVVLQLHSPL